MIKLLEICANGFWIQRHLWPGRQRSASEHAAKASRVFWSRATGFYSFFLFLSKNNDLFEEKHLTPSLRRDLTLCNYDTHREQCGVWTLCRERAGDAFCTKLHTECWLGLKRTASPFIAVTNLCHHYLSLGRSYYPAHMHCQLISHPSRKCCICYRWEAFIPRWLFISASFHINATPSRVVFKIHRSIGGWKICIEYLVGVIYFFFGDARIENFCRYIYIFFCQRCIEENEVAWSGFARAVFCLDFAPLPISNILSFFETSLLELIFASVAKDKTNTRNGMVGLGRGLFSSRRLKNDFFKHNFTYKTL